MNYLYRFPVIYDLPIAYGDVIKILEKATSNVLWDIIHKITHMEILKKLLDEKELTVFIKAVFENGEHNHREIIIYELYNANLLSLTKTQLEIIRKLLYLSRFESVKKEKL